MPKRLNPGPMLLVCAALWSVVAQSAEAGLGFTWHPAAVGLPGAALSGDLVRAEEWSLIRPDASGGFTERGLIRATGLFDGAADVTPTGLNSEYTLYFAYELTGRFNTMTSLAMEFFGVAGVAGFGHDSNDQAFIDTGANSPLLLGASELVEGVVGSAADGDVYARLLATLTPTPASFDFFETPMQTVWLQGDFFHDVQAGGVTPLPTGAIKIAGGDIRLQLVPLPASWLLLATGLAFLRLGRQQ